MNWHAAGTLLDYPVDQSKTVRVDGRLIAIFNVDGTLFATAPHCTHARALLSDGYFENGEVECPLHEARFDVRTGKALCAPATRDLRTYAVKLSGDGVFVELPEPVAPPSASA